MIVHVARKPLSEGSLAANILKHGCGGLNIDKSRISTGDVLQGGVGGLLSNVRDDREWGDHAGPDDNGFRPSAQGRWPANLILCHIADLEQQSGVTRAGGHPSKRAPDKQRTAYNKDWKGGVNEEPGVRASEGTAARFFKQIQEQDQ